MSDIELLKAYHRAYRTALSIHHKWDDGDEVELLRQSNELIDAVKPLTDAVGSDWHRSKNLERHLKCVRSFLKNGEQDSASTDIDDLIYADMPALFDELLKLAEK